MSLAEVRRW